MPVLADKVAPAAAQRRGPIKRKTGDKPVSCAADDRLPCPAPPMSPSRKRACAVPCPTSSDNVIHPHTAKKGRQEAENPELSAKPTAAAGTEPVIQDADAISSPAPNQPSGADDNHTDLECDVPPVPPSCGKCGGAHASEKCPHYEDDCENHKDAQENLGQGHPARARVSTGDYFLLPCSRAGIVRQPGDGSCLYHALLYGLDNSYKASAEKALMLRQELASFLLDNAELTQSGDALREWVEWEDPSLWSGAFVVRPSWGGEGLWRWFAVPVLKV